MEKPKSKKAGIAYGRTTGLTRGQYICAVFSAQATERFTDSEICEIMADEFPEYRQKYTPQLVSFYRNRYNRGELAPQRGKRPKEKVVRYGNDGRLLAQTKGPPPKE